MVKRIFSKRNRALLAELVRTDFKLRYQGSVLGYTWSLLKPLLLFGILYIVFAEFLRLGREIENFPIYLLLGIVLWAFFSEMTQQSLTSIVARSDLIRKIRIPRWIIIASSSVSAIISLSLNMLIVLVFIIFSGVDFQISSLWLPIIIVQIYILGLGFSLLLSAAYVKYRDVTYIWEVILQAFFYATPILYPLNMITDVTFQQILMLNPMAQMIQDARWAVVTPDTLTIADVFGGAGYRLITIGMTFAVLIVGIIYFKRQSTHFAENL